MKDSAVKTEQRLPLDFWHQQFIAMQKIYHLLLRPDETEKDLVAEYTDKLQAYGDTVTTSYSVAKLKLQYWLESRTLTENFRADFMVSFLNTCLPKLTFSLAIRF